MANGVNGTKGTRGNATSDSGDDGPDNGKTIVFGEPVAGEPDGVVRVAADGDNGVSWAEFGDGTKFTDPAATPAPDSGRTPRRGRGRPRGSRAGAGDSPSAGKRTPGKTQTSHDLTEILVALHWALAKSLSIDELQMDNEDAKKLSDAVLRVTDLYDVPLPSEKIMAWILLGKTCGEVYGTRIIAYNLNHRNRPEVIDAKV